jgi:hypothetical protein
MAGLGRFLRTLRASAHSACGWLAYRLGWHTFAQKRFERVLLLRGDDFRAYVHLGRIAFDLGDYAGWRREFEHARRADPERFARLRHPLELFEPRLAGTQFDGAATTDFDATGTRATWRALHPFGSERRQRRGGDSPLGPDFDALLPGYDVPGFDDLPGPETATGYGARQKALDTGAPIESFDAANRPSRHGARRGEHDALPDASTSHDDFASAAERHQFRDRGPIARGEIERCDIDDLARRLTGR